MKQPVGRKAIASTKGPAMPIPEYMKVRAHLFNLITRSDGKTQQIPTENELCRLFKVSRITVRGAIKGLVQDRYLVPRRGIGTFMNPGRISREAPRFPIIGLLQGDGRCILTPFDPDLASGIRHSGMSFELLHVPDSDSPDRLVEIVKSGFDGVVWRNSAGIPANRRYLAALARSGIPLLLVEDEEMPAPGHDGILSSRAQRGVAIAAHLHAKGHRQVLFIHHHPPAAAASLSGKGSTYDACRTRLATLGGGARKRHGTDIRSFLEFKERLRHKDAFLADFTVIYSSNHLARFVMEELRKAHVSVPEDLSYLLYGETDPYFFDGLKPDHMDTKSPIRQALFEWLGTRILAEAPAATFARNVVMKVVDGETVRPLGKRP
jgi:hypothetical protein